MSNMAILLILLLFTILCAIWTIIALIFTGYSPFKRRIVTLMAGIIGTFVLFMCTGYMASKNPPQTQQAVQEQATKDKPQSVQDEPTFDYDYYVDTWLPNQIMADTNNAVTVENVMSVDLDPDYSRKGYVNVKIEYETLKGTEKQLIQELIAINDAVRSNDYPVSNIYIVAKHSVMDGQGNKKGLMWVANRKTDANNNTEFLEINKLLIKE